MIFKPIYLTLLLNTTLFVTGAMAEETKTEITREQVQKEVSEAIEAIRGYSVQKRDEALTKAGEALDRLDQEIDAQEQVLRENWSKMSESARNSSQEALEDLRRRRQDLSEWYGAMKHGGEKAWDEIKRGFSKAYEKLKDAWSRTSAQTAASPK